MSYRSVATFTATALLTLAATSGAMAGPAKTAQGIWVNLTAPENFGIVDQEIYQYLTSTAAGYFTNLWDGNAPTVSCTGSPSNCANPAPPAPGAPVPDSSKVTGVSQSAVSDNKCTFFTGGALQGSTYTQTVNVVVGSTSTKRTYTYTYTYIVAPNPTSVDPLTAWTLFNSNPGGLAEVTVNADIAGESVLSKDTDKKFSFSLRNPDTSSRITGLTVALTGDDTDTQYPAHQILENAPGALAGDEGAVDFNYVTNAGSNGTISLLKNGDARTILNDQSFSGDNFAGNNNGGADGSALAKAVMDEVVFELGEGDYNIALTGTVKGNSALSSLNFGISQTLHIIGQGCGEL